MSIPVGVQQAVPFFNDEIANLLITPFVNEGVAPRISSALYFVNSTIRCVTFHSSVSKVTSFTFANFWFSTKTSLSINSLKFVKTFVSKIVITNFLTVSFWFLKKKRDYKKVGLTQLGIL